MIADERLIEMLCCPACRGCLTKAHALSGLVCSFCGESFKSSGGIFEMFSRADLFNREFLKYREAYEKHAKGHPDVTQWSWLEMLAGFMGDRGDSLTLDVGSADGKLGGVISGEVVCFDISLTSLKAARGKGLAAVAGNAEALPFRRVFDAVVLSNILEHVPRPEIIIEQAEALLKPSGQLYVIVPYKEDLTWYEGEDILDPHLSSFDIPRIKGLLKNFRITRHKFILFTASRPLYFLKFRLRDVNPVLYKGLRRTKEAWGKDKKKVNFPKWRNALNYFPNALVMPFMRPYLIMIEAKLIGPGE